MVGVAGIAGVAGMVGVAGGDWLKKGRLLMHLMKAD